MANLRRILLDSVRLRSGEDLVDARLAAGLVPAPVGVLMTDVDSSATIRAHGIETKIELVRACRERLSALIPPDAIVVDCGTRDETYVVLPATDASRAALIAEQIRAGVAREPFTLSALDSPQSVTVSVGYVECERPTSAADLFARVREAQHAAKAVRDCVRTADPAPTRITFAAPSWLVRAGTAAGLDPTAATAMGLRALEQKYTGIAHWAVDRAGVSDGRLLDTDDLDFDGAPPYEAEFFRRLVASVVFEAVLARRIEAGEPTRVSVVAGGPASGALLSVPYLLGDWLAAYPSAEFDACVGGASPLELVLAARGAVAGSVGPATDTRSHHAGTVEVAVDQLPSQAALIRKVSAARGLSHGALLTEAMALGVDWVSCRRQYT